MTFSYICTANILQYKLYRKLVHELNQFMIWNLFKTDLAVKSEELWRWGWGSRSRWGGRWPRGWRRRHRRSATGSWRRRLIGAIGSLDLGPNSSFLRHFYQSVIQKKSFFKIIILLAVFSEVLALAVFSKKCLNWQFSGENLEEKKNWGFLFLNRGQLSPLLS